MKFFRCFLFIVIICVLSISCSERTPVEQPDITPPVAKLEVLHDSLTSSNYFNFTGENSKCFQDGIEISNPGMYYRFDYDGDGHFDTGFTFHNSSFYHAMSLQKEGTFNAVMEVKDMNGITDKDTVVVKTTKPVKIIIPDKAFEQEIRSKILVPNAELYDAHLIDIGRLYLRDSTITSLSGIEYCFYLNWLELPKSKVEDFSVLSNLVNLERLDIIENPFQEFSIISKNKELSYLKLSFCEISDIDGIENLVNLKEVWLNHNSIVDISKLEHLSKIEKLYLYCNSIEDIEPLLKNPNIGEGCYLNLQNNPLSSKSKTEYIPQLINKGVRVDWDGSK